MRVYARNNQTKETFSFEVTIKVSADDGTFSAELSDKFAQALKEKGIFEAPPGTPVEATTLKGLEYILQELANKLVRSEIIDDCYVIKYQIETVAEYTKDKKGNYFPSASMTIPNATDENTCHGTKIPTRQFPEAYGLRVYCGIWRKKTYRQHNGKTISRYNQELVNFPQDSNLEWISNIRNNSNGEHFFSQSDYDNMQELPANEQNAMFFRKLYTAIFKLNDMIKPFAQGDILLRTIESSCTPAIDIINH